MTGKLSTGNAFTMFKGEGFLTNDKAIMRSERTKLAGVQQQRKSYQPTKINLKSTKHERH